MNQTYTFYVQGMHCQACETLIESELSDLPSVTKAKASLGELKVDVVGEFDNQKSEQIIINLNNVLKPHGYTLSLTASSQKVVWTDFYWALPLAMIIFALFIILQKLGVVNLVSINNMNYGTAIIIGLVASVSTCMAVVGGLVLSMSANFSKFGSKIKPQLFFHLGRLLSFFILGGVIGIVGTSFQFSKFGMLLLGVIVGLVMFILGLNLMDIFPRIKKLQFTLPSFFGRSVLRLKNLNHTFMPFFVGVATFFLPCGFTQSMQIFALTTGSFLNSAMFMFMFALGTFPVLAMISFSSFKVIDKSWKGIFFKTVGLLVIFFGIFNIINSLTGAGLIDPFFNI